jgi:hypothetical protein
LALLGEEFTLLQYFSGDLSTVPPSTAALESAFSQIKWEKTEFTSALADFSLEGILCCKE